MCVCVEAQRLANQKCDSPCDSMQTGGVCICTVECEWVKSSLKVEALRSPQTRPNARTLNHDVSVILQIVVCVSIKDC